MAKANKPEKQAEPQRNLTLEEVDRLCREQVKLTEEVLVVLRNAIIPGLDDQVSQATSFFS
jgi:hypothetical protein